LKSITLLLTLAAVSISGAWQPAENPGDTINSSSNDWYPVIAEDESYMIFVSDRPGGYGAGDIWISYESGGDWGTPQNLGANTNTVYGESAPYLAENDTKLYFLSMDPSGEGNGDIWYCPMSGGVPGAKVNLGTPINTSNIECCPLPSKDGNYFYFCSFRSGGYGDMDVWVSENDGGTWGTPYNAGGDINSSSTDCPRWISDDGNTIVISSTASGGFGNADLYYSTKAGGTFGVPTNFGSVINTSAAEWGPGFTDNSGAVGGTIYFGSGRSGGYGGWDIWKCSGGNAVESVSLGTLKAVYK